MSEATYSRDRPAIPEISDTEAWARYVRIRPLLRHEGVLHAFRAPEDYHVANTSINWVKDNKGEPVDANTLVLLAALPTYHRAMYHGMFRLQVSEVLAQIPAELLSRVTAFEVLFGQDLTEIVDSDDVYGHRTTTLLYGTRP